MQEILSFDSLWQEEIFECVRSWIIQWQDIQYDSWQFISNHTMITLWKTLILCRWTTSVCTGESLGSRVNKLCNVLYILSTHMCVRTRTVPAYTLLWCSDLFCSVLFYWISWADRISQPIDTHNLISHTRTDRQTDGRIDIFYNFIRLLHVMLN